MNNPFIKFRRQLITKGLESFGLYYGDYEGVVSDNNDPENRGRILLKCPATYGKVTFNKWALPKGMPLGKKKGLFFIPSEGDNVWVSFKNGNPEFPVWTYGWYTKDIDKNEAEVGKYLFFTESGYKLLIDEKNSQIKLYFDEKTELLLNKDAITLKYDTGTIVLNKNKKLSINVNGINMKDYWETLTNIFKDGIMTGNSGPYVWSPATLVLVEKQLLELNKFME